jgi:hypothetical protein
VRKPPPTLLPTAILPAGAIEKDGTGIGLGLNLELSGSCLILISDLMIMFACDDIFCLPLTYGLGGSAE